MVILYFSYPSLNKTNPTRSNKAQGNKQSIQPRDNPKFRVKKQKRNTSQNSEITLKCRWIALQLDQQQLHQPESHREPPAQSQNPPRLENPLSRGTCSYRQERSSKRPGLIYANADPLPYWIRWQYKRPMWEIWDDGWWYAAEEFGI